MTARATLQTDSQEQDQERLIRISRAIHARPETRFEEEFAAEFLASELERIGMSVERGYAGLPTSFRGTHTTGVPGPTVAILLEYDALPGIGHGCGHNLIAAAGVTAAARVIQQQPEHPGTFTVIGTPGEEGGGGKIKILDAGGFAGVDAAMMVHPADRSLIARHGLAAHHLEVTWSGRASHAAKSPEQGRSALAAAYLFLNSLDAMRQFVPSSARFHGIITNGGQAPNIVPDSAACVIYIRDLVDSDAVALRQRIENAARGMALATDTTVSFAETAPTYAARNNNLTMARRFGSHLAAHGVIAEEPNSTNPAGSSDIGNVSARVPTIHPYIQITDRGVANHTREFASAALTDQAHSQSLAAAMAMADVTIDLLSDPDLLDAVRQEFLATTDGGDHGASNN